MVPDVHFHRRKFFIRSHFSATVRYYRSLTGTNQHQNSKRLFRSLLCPRLRLPSGQRHGRNVGAQLIIRPRKPNLLTTWYVKPRGIYRGKSVECGNTRPITKSARFPSVWIRTQQVHSTLSASTITHCC